MAERVVHGSCKGDALPPCGISLYQEVQNFIKDRSQAELNVII